MRTVRKMCGWREFYIMARESRGQIQRFSQIRRTTSEYTDSESNQIATSEYTASDLRETLRIELNMCPNVVSVIADSHSVFFSHLAILTLSWQ